MALTSTDRAASLMIETRREEFGMPKAELARRAHVSLRALTYYLEGERAMTLGTFETLCTVLQIPQEERGSRLSAALAALDDADH